MATKPRGTMLRHMGRVGPFRHHNPLEDMLAQLDKAGRILNAGRNDIEPLRHPKRQVVVSGADGMHALQTAVAIAAAVRASAPTPP